MSGNDDVLERRAAAAKWSKRAKSAGYGCIAVACVIFLIGFFADFRPWMIAATAWCFGLSALLLVPAVIIGYGIKMAEREDRATQQ